MPVSVGAYTGRSCWDKVKSGVVTGFCVGLASGLLFGGFTSFRYGLRGKELASNVVKSMGQGGGTFATFMAVGSVIRC